VLEQCFDGHIGALCGACDDKYDFDIAQNRCVSCSSSLKTAAHAGSLLLPCALLAASISLLLRARFCQRMRWVWESALVFAKEGLGALEHEEIKKKFRKSLLTKAKVVIAAWQIAASTVTVRTFLAKELSDSF